jgi:hypothetical protein
MVAPCEHWGLRDNIFSFVHPGGTRRDTDVKEYTYVLLLIPKDSAIKKD